MFSPAVSRLRFAGHLHLLCHPAGRIFGAAAPPHGARRTSFRTYTTNAIPDIYEDGAPPRPTPPRRKIQIQLSGPILEAEAKSLLSVYPGFRYMKIDSRRPEKPVISAWFQQESQLVAALDMMQKEPIVRNGIQARARSIEGRTTYAFNAPQEVMERLEPILCGMPGMTRFEIRRHYWFYDGEEPTESQPKISVHLKGEQNAVEALDVIKTYAAEGTWITKKVGASVFKMLSQNPE
ncbi:hypothetical protein BOTBODRAFT_35112 [Botryobasidium botryosum FD-172 SS1]|uniref:Uncharacterized protein n=1 Tax=Botryobasidium botryosum (strain FD-172 SS1) TaxID=930990 RepID=A0A067M7C1_BOTB1|nr:hypothetical protein BOTBODRAFT_35112 [Botryobasidium botryosum FD-172 SS1]